MRSDPGLLTVAHGDLHYENVLHALPGQPPRWVAIDPLPVAGTRNGRWPRSSATGGTTPPRRVTPSAHSAAGFDILCERAALDRHLAQAVLQAVAVDNVLWLSRATDVGPLVRSFLHPYSIVARW